MKITKNDYKKYLYLQDKIKKIEETNNETLKNLNNELNVLVVNKSEVEEKLRIILKQKLLLAGFDFDKEREPQGHRYRITNGKIESCDYQCRSWYSINFFSSWRSIFKRHSWLINKVDSEFIYDAEKIKEYVKELEELKKFGTEVPVKDKNGMLFKGYYSSDGVSIKQHEGKLNTAACTLKSHFDKSEAKIEYGFNRTSISILDTDEFKRDVNKCRNVLRKNLKQFKQTKNKIDKILKKYESELVLEAL